MNTIRTSLALFSLITLTACTTYYEVTDPTTNKKYYTTELDKNGDGSVTLEAEGSGVEVTIQNSEVREVSEEAYKSGAFPSPSAEPAE